MKDAIVIAALQATFDEQSGEFVIHTPKDTASKFWIGGAAQHGKVHVMAILNFHGASNGQHPAFNLLEHCVLLVTGLEQPLMACVGSAADRHGVAPQVCTVFAQLMVRGKWEGPHVFVVRIRDDQGCLMRGVRILDNGAKVGCLFVLPQKHAQLLLGGWYNACLVCVAPRAP